MACDGVEAASRGFFGKHASELSLPEAGAAGRSREVALDLRAHGESRTRHLRRNVVLQAMLDNHAINRAAVAVRSLARRRSCCTIAFAPDDLARSSISRSKCGSVSSAASAGHASIKVASRVFTTINVPMQLAAEASVAASLKTLDAKRQALAAARRVRGSSDVGPDPMLQAALVTMDPTNGHVRAMVGGRDFDASRFNRAVQAHRQPGSAFKPFVYAAALEAGYTPATVLDHLNDPVATLQGDWAPEDEHSTADVMSLRTGLRTSSNRAAVRLLQLVGIPRTVQYAKTMGVGNMPSVPSLALGSGEVTLQSLTAAYAAFANKGLVPRPLLVRRVEDRDGHVLYAADDVSTRAVSDTTAFLMSSMMADAVNAGTATRARALGFTLPAAGKTGTTNSFHDAWFVGYTPSLVTGVWVGFDQPRAILPNGFAADIAVPLWTSFMKTCHDEGDPPRVV